MSVLVRAQAKINLHLALLGREESGYHSIETVFHRIELADDVVVQLAPPGRREVRCSVDVGAMRENLAYRAAVAFLEMAAWETGFDVQIVKRIPAGGGLGGGSADAAATLRGLNALRETPVADERLLSLAATLGADVPFLVSDAVMALAWGRGERMLALEPLPHRHVALVIPPFRVATADAYRWVDEARAETQPLEARALRYWHLANWDGLAPRVWNDFEPVVARRFRWVTAIVESLRGHGAAIAGMTGSGSTLFGIYETVPDREALARATGCEVVVTEIAATHPAPARMAIEAPI